MISLGDIFMVYRPGLDRKDADTWRKIFKDPAPAVFWPEVLRLLRSLQAQIIPGRYPARCCVILPSGRIWTFNEPPDDQPLTELFVAEIRLFL
jgi:hypothetical protein